MGSSGFSWWKIQQCPRRITASKKRVAAQTVLALGGGLQPLMPSLQHLRILMLDFVLHKLILQSIKGKNYLSSAELKEKFWNDKDGFIKLPKWKQNKPQNDPSIVRSPRSPRKSQGLSYLFCPLWLSYNWAVITGWPGPARLFSG